MRFRTLIFDLDGTISDPSAGIVHCVNHALKSVGYDVADPARIRRLIGPPLVEIFESLTGESRDEPMLALITAYRERYARSGYRENVLYPDIPRVIKRLAGKAATLGICTSKRADYASKIVDMFGLSPYFSFIDGGDIHVKKNMQLRTLVSNGLDAESAVMIGDRAIDIEAAKANRIGSVGVCWGFGDRDEIDRAGPDMTAATPADLLQLLR